jgi:hypothetical protein
LNAWVNAEKASGQKNSSDATAQPACTGGGVGAGSGAGAISRPVLCSDGVGPGPGASVISDLLTLRASMPNDRPVEL